MRGGVLCGVHGRQLGPGRTIRAVTEGDDRLAIDGGTPVRTDPLVFAKGAALLGRQEADAVAAVVRSGSLFRYK